MCVELTKTWRFGQIKRSNFDEIVCSDQTEENGSSITVNDCGQPHKPPDQLLQNQDRTSSIS